MKPNEQPTAPLKASPILSWEVPLQKPEKSDDKIVDLAAYRHSQETVLETTTVSWDLQVKGIALQPVKLLMVSSGFTSRSFGGNTVCRMAA